MLKLWLNKMNYKKLGTSDLKISKIAMGTMTWGQQNTLEEAFKQMDYAYEKGINIFDSAELYPVPPSAETQGETSRILGQWVKSRKVRDKVIVADKIVGRSKMEWFRNDGIETRLNQQQIEFALDRTLKNLQMDYVDLYQLHWPDRPINTFTGLEYEHTETADVVPIEETLSILDKLVQKGKIRYIGLSNETAWGTSQFLKASSEKQLSRIVSIQNPYSLLNRSFEVGLSEISIRENVGLLAYSPLASGVLSGKYFDGKCQLEVECSYLDIVIQDTKLLMQSQQQNNIMRLLKNMAYIHAKWQLNFAKCKNLRQRSLLGQLAWNS